MIDKREILETSEQTSLKPNVVEKDYVLGWMLAGISAHQALTERWVFKGGTCLKKCFFETYRFSEDLDFTLLDPEHLNEDFLRSVFEEIGEWIYEEAGIQIPPERIQFEVYKNPRGQLSCQGKVSYIGPISPTRPPPAIKLDLTADERIVLPPVRVPVFHPYKDAPEDGIDILAYAYEEAFAEKFRALAERTRPRDLYDVVHLFRNVDMRPEQQHFVEVLRAKCEFKGIDLPRIVDIEPHRGELEAGWANMLAHQLPALLPVEQFWDALPEIFAWLEGVIVPVMSEMPLGSGEVLIRERIIGEPTIAQSFVEMIRFAAANHLLVELDYCDTLGVRSTRAIEAYSLRRSREGNVLLMAVRADNGQPRSYRLNRILGVRATQIAFSPRHPIELTPSGAQGIPSTSRSSSSLSAGLSPTRHTTLRSTSSRSRPGGAGGPTYVFCCSICGKKFSKKSYDASLNRHKNNKTGSDCYGTFGTHVTTKY